MNKRLLFSAVFLLSVLFVGCNQSDGDSTIYGKSWEEKWTVASKTITATGANGPETCYWIKVDNNPVWQITHSHINGFYYECGYEYELLVKAQEILNPPQDVSSSEYTLISIVSKKRKESDVPLLTNTPLECMSNAETFFNGSKQLSDSVAVIEGDILLSKEQTDIIMTRSGAIKDVIKYWPGNIVYYTFAQDFSLQSNVERAINEWENKTSLTFVNGTGNGNYIEFFHGPGNYSSLGMVGGKQQISLSINGSNYGSAIHEIGHAVGLIHEQCRHDRDSYITIHTSNIEPEMLHNFSKYGSNVVCDVGTFDFGSIMLYGSFAFSANSQATMTTKDGLYFYGQRTHLSDGDVQGVAAMYGPPFIVLRYDTQVIRDEVNGLDEIYECSVSYMIKVFADKNCTQPTTLEFPRIVTVYEYKRIYDSDSDRVKTTTSHYNVTLPAGCGSYSIGPVHNIERYHMSDPVELDVTTCSISVPPATQL